LKFEDNPSFTLICASVQDPPEGTPRVVKAHDARNGLRKSRRRGSE
jgi:hypothetical protein